MSDAVISSVTAYKHDGCTATVGGDSSSDPQLTHHHLKKTQLCAVVAVIHWKATIADFHPWISWICLASVISVLQRRTFTFTWHGSWIVWISTRSSILPSSNRKCFQLVLALRWTPQPISFFSVVLFCCTLLVLQAALCFIKTVRHFHIKKSRKWHCRL